MRSLINEIIRFCMAYDQHAFNDTFESAEHAYTEISETLRDEPQYIIETMQDIVSETDNQTFVRRAQAIIKKVRDL